MGFTSYSVDNDKKFRNKLAKVLKQTSDLTIPLTLISKDFYKSEKAIFMLKSPGLYPDLSARYKKVKQKKVGFLYPILKRSGALEQSVTDPTDSQAINQILNKNTLVIGTKVPYAVFHQSDAPRKRLPLRKFLFIGPEAPRFAINETKGRLERWTGILEGFLKQTLAQEFGS